MQAEVGSQDSHILLSLVTLQIGESTWQVATHARQKNNPINAMPATLQLWAK